jgi:hypothetical protein
METEEAFWFEMGPFRGSYEPEFGARPRQYTRPIDRMINGPLLPVHQGVVLFRLHTCTFFSWQISVVLATGSFTDWRVYDEKALLIQILLAVALIVRHDMIEHRRDVADLSMTERALVDCPILVERFRLVSEQIECAAMIALLNRP